ncbi:hypothetical protein [Streptomyces sp. SPB162]|uniref:hypothetical protein n=1 Tax=Streptomyces sp. SPB162 TaxID=2940560 RepID=UPI002406D6D1|nr:hypothetical protein [Streptomyces sp. SPB162]MDF9813724.1 hypothetical protein [Streptomyces sp. SPB162]
MLFLGLVLLAATGTLTALLIADNLGGGPDYTVALLGHDLVRMNSLAIFCAGLALALVFCLSLAMAGEGAKLRRRKAVRLREARKDADAAVAERDALAARVEQQRTENEPPERTPDPEAPLAQPRKHGTPHAFGS